MLIFVRHLVTLLIGIVRTDRLRPGIKLNSGVTYHSPQRRCFRPVASQTEIYAQLHT